MKEGASVVLSRYRQPLWNTGRRTPQQSPGRRVLQPLPVGRRTFISPGRRVSASKLSPVVRDLVRRKQWSTDKG
jgi:hypothetical protein